MKQIALLLDGIDGNASSALTEMGFGVIVKPIISHDELLAIMPEISFLAVRSQTRVTADILSAGKNLVACGRGGAGLDSIDLELASKLGIICFACPGANAESVAEVALAHILSVLHKMPLGAIGMSQSKWLKKQCKGSSLYGRTVGLVGMGYVGKWLSRLLEPFAVNIISYDIDPAAALPWVPFVEDLPTLLAAADVVTLHAPCVAGTKGMVDSAFLAQMKPGATLINCARGELVVSQAIIDALLAGTLSSYAADVFKTEPPDFSNDLLFAHPELIQSGQLYFTPHLAASSEEAQSNVADMLVEQARRLFVRGEMPWGANFPRFYLPRTGKQRLMVIHSDSQGVIAAISGILRQVVNVAGNVNQRIKPGGSAYTVFDLDGEVIAETLLAIKKVEGVLRVNVV